MSGSFQFNMDKKLFKMSPEELLKFINENCKLQVDEVPPGWFTINQLAKQSKVEPRTLRSKIKSAYEAGKLERRVFKVALGTDVIRPCPHYRKKG